MLITYDQNGRGRSGHKLKDIISAFIFSFFIDGSQVRSHPSWKHQHILKNINVPEVNLKKHNVYNISNIKNWDGISYEEFTQILSDIKKTPNSYVIVFSNVCRVHPYQLHNWYQEGKLAEDYFTNKFLPLIKKFYYGNTKPQSVNQVAIHVRRGDVAKRMIKEGYDVSYYTNIINEFNNHVNIPIRIYSETLNSQDLMELKHLDNVKLMLGGPEDIDTHYRQMVTSRYFVISNSSFATWAAYISNGTIFCDKDVKHFNHYVYPPNIHLIEDLKKVIA